MQLEDTLALTSAFVRLRRAKPALCPQPSLGATARRARRGRIAGEQWPESSPSPRPSPSGEGESPKNSGPRVRPHPDPLPQERGNRRRTMARKFALTPALSPWERENRRSLEFEVF